MKREVQRELLDELPADDRGAIGSRQDLQKINGWMGHARIMARALTSAFPDRSRGSIVELGQVMWTLLLRLAKRFAPDWKGSRVVLVDGQALLRPSAKVQLEALSCHIEPVQMNIFDWLQRPYSEPSDVTIANLFLHHFVEDDLRDLLRHAANQTGFFLARVPRRMHFLFCAARLLPLIGCNEVSRHDVGISIRTGFTENKLSALWPVDLGWRLTERRAGTFTHCWAAQVIGEGAF
jgi:hypothetical protein